MKFRTLSGLASLAAALLLLSASSSFAADDKAKAPSASASKAGASAVKPKTTEKTKPAAPVQLVDINSASNEELRKLPGISDADAKKIIAGRPYLSKAFLVTNNIISLPAYQGLSKLIVAKQKNKAKPKK